MKRKVTKMSDEQKSRLVDINRRVFWRLNKALAIKNGLMPNNHATAYDKLPLVSFGLLPPLAFADFGARMANTKTHRRNNK